MRMAEQRAEQNINLQICHKSRRLGCVIPRCSYTAGSCNLYFNVFDITVHVRQSWITTQRDKNKSLGGLGSSKLLWQIWRQSYRMIEGHYGHHTNHYSSPTTLLSMTFFVLMWKVGSFRSRKFSFLYPELKSTIPLSVHLSHPPILPNLCVCGRQPATSRGLQAGRQACS